MVVFLFHCQLVKQCVFAWPKLQAIPFCYFHSTKQTVLAQFKQNVVRHLYKNVQFNFRNEENIIKNLYANVLYFLRLNDVMCLCFVFLPFFISKCVCWMDYCFIFNFPVFWSQPSPCLPQSHLAEQILHARFTDSNAHINSKSPTQRSETGKLLSEKKKILVAVLDQNITEGRVVAIEVMLFVCFLFIQVITLRGVIAFWVSHTPWHFRFYQLESTLPLYYRRQGTTRVLNVQEDNLCGQNIRLAMVKSSTLKKIDA